MRAARSNPDINAFLDAYGALGVEHSANPAEIRHAYKLLVRSHHPDRHAAGSTGEHHATGRMAAINAAYHLIREAPLRHHRVSTRARPDDPWTDAELDDAIQRARNERVFSNLLSVATLVAVSFFMPWLLRSVAGSQGMSPIVAFVAMVPFYLMTMVIISQGTGFLYLWYAIRLFRLLTRF